MIDPRKYHAAIFGGFLPLTTRLKTGALKFHRCHSLLGRRAVVNTKRARPSQKTIGTINRYGNALRTHSTWVSYQSYGIVMRYKIRMEVLVLRRKAIPVANGVKTMVRMVEGLLPAHVRLFNKLPRSRTPISFYDPSSTFQLSRPPSLYSKSRLKYSRLVDTTYPSCLAEAIRTRAPAPTAR